MGKKNSVFIFLILPFIYYIGTGNKNLIVWLLFFFIFLLYGADRYFSIN